MGAGSEAQESHARVLGGAGPGRVPLQSGAASDSQGGATLSESYSRTSLANRHTTCAAIPKIAVIDVDDS